VPRWTTHPPWTRGWRYAHPETAQVEIRTAADVTGDGRLDLVGVLVVRSTTTVVFPGAADDARARQRALRCG